MELTLNDTRSRSVLKDVFLELLQENKMLSIDIMGEAMAEINIFNTSFENNLDVSTDKKDIPSRAGIYYRCGSRIDIHEIDHEKDGETNSNRVDSWDSLVQNVDQFAVDTGIEDFAVNLDHYLYDHLKRESL